MNDYSVYLKLNGYKEVVCVQSGLSSSKAQQLCVALNQKQKESYFFSNSKEKIMKTTIYSTGKTGRTIVTESVILGSNLKRTMVVFPNGTSESKFSRNPFCKY